MPDILAVGLNSRPIHACEYGNLAVHLDTVIATLGALGDRYRALRIPAGTVLTDLDLINDDLDTNGVPTLQVKVGYSFCDGSAAPGGADEYFTASGSTFLRSAGRAQMQFKPISFEQDIYVDIVVTQAAATFAQGEIVTVAKGEAIGVK